MRRTLIAGTLVALTLLLIPVATSAAPAAKPTTTTAAPTTTTAPPSGIPGYQVVTAVAVNPTGGSVSGTLDAQCPTGKVVLGGGWNSRELDAPDLTVHASFPQIINSNESWWSIRYKVTGPVNPYTLTVYAICATAS